MRCRDAGLRSASDVEVLTYSAEHGLVIVSHDVNTMSAAAWGRVENGDLMSGLILVPQSLSLHAVIDDLILIWSATAAEEWLNNVVFLPLSR